jgi:TonB family protein
MTDVIAASPLARAVGLTLVHFVWQGALLGALTGLVLVLLRRADAGLRHLVACLGLLAMTMAPVLTMAAIARAPGLLTRDVAAAASASLAPASADPMPGLAAAGAGTAWQAGLERQLPWIALAWLAGVLLLTLRIARDWIAVRRIRRSAVGRVGDALGSVVRRLAGDLGLDRLPPIVESLHVDVPMVVGWIRPAILVPASALAELSPSQLEAIVMHELAHVRRHDHVINALQGLVETIFFYHPAVWWLSNRIRIEREHCCDDLAVVRCDSPVSYACALATLEESRQGTLAFRLPATGGALLARIRRLLGAPDMRRPQPSLSMVLCIVTLVSAAIVGGRTQAVTAETARVSAAAAQEATEQVILGFEEQLRLARVRGDVATLDRLLNEAFAGTRQDGTTEDKPQALRRASVSRPALTSGLATVRLADDTAVVTGSQVEGAGGRAETVLFTRVWMRRDGRWTLISNSQFRDPRGVHRAAGGPAATGGQDGASTPVRSGVSARAVRIGGSRGAPRKIGNVSPIYPKVALASHVSGLVILDATIDEQGNVVDAQVLRSVPMFDQAAVDAVLQWKYAPYMVDGRPTAVAMTVTVNFQAR